MTQEPYTVSILVPVYGVEKYIERCARSIFEQTYHDLDIVFIDDCTPDKSIDILKRVLNDYLERKEQTRIIKHERNKGIAATRNTGINVAKGTFLTYVDSDDWIELNAVEELVKKQVETGAEIITGLALINEDTSDMRYIEPVYKNKEEMLTNILSQPCHHELWGRLFKKSLFYDVKALEGNNFGEDLRLLTMSVWYANKVSRLDKSIYHYRIRENSMVTCDKTWRQTQDALWQDFNNTLSLKKFFDEKNKVFSCLALMGGVKKRYFFMPEACKHHDRPLYNAVQKELLSGNSAMLKRALGYKIYVIISSPFSYYILPLYLWAAPKLNFLFRLIRHKRN